MAKIKFMILSFVCYLLFAVNFAGAAPQMIEATGVYIMDTERDKTFAVAEDRARKEALRAAVEQSELYLQNVSKNINDKLTKDELQVLAAAVLKVQNESVSKKVDGKNIEYTVSITALVDVDSLNLDEIVAKKKTWEHRVEENQRQQEEYEKLKTENERLKANFAKAKTKSERKKIKAASIKNNKLFEANQYLNAGEWLKALETDPTNADEDIETILKRGQMYLEPRRMILQESIAERDKRYENALAEFNKVIKLDPNNADAYYWRGKVYFQKGWDNGEFMPTATQTPFFDMAQKDLNKCLEINPDHNDAKQLLQRMNFVGNTRDQYKGKAIMP